MEYCKADITAYHPKLRYRNGKWVDINPKRFVIEEYTNDGDTVIDCDSCLRYCIPEGDTGYRYFDGKYYHYFCDKSCAKQHLNNGYWY